MPFGLRNDASTFQRTMDNIFCDVNCVFTYIDDILIYSDDEKSHLEDIHTVLKKLSEYDLKISLSKCVFMVPELDFLGCNISCDGLKPTLSKINELNEFPSPNDSKSLRRFLGMIGFYRKLVPNFASLVLPLTECIRLNPNAKKLTLSETELKSFRNIKALLSDISALSHPRSDSTNFQLVTDSSQYAVGAALHQMNDGQAIPIGFFSKKTIPSPTKVFCF